MANASSSVNKSIMCSTMAPKPIEYPSMATRNRPGSANKQSLFGKSCSSGFISIFYAIGEKPLEIWDKQLRNGGYVKRVTDTDIRSLVMEIVGDNVATNFITTPISPNQSLGITLPYAVLLAKNIKRYFTFEIQVKDDLGARRRLKMSNYQTTARIRPLSCSLPLKMEPGWNQICLDLQEMVSRAFGTNYVETLRLQIHANCRLRRVYFCDIMTDGNIKK